MEPMLSTAHENSSECYEVRTNDGTTLVGIAQGIARCNVPSKTSQDLMFFAGEQVVLLERLQSGLCMGFCEGSVGQFKEQDVDFISSKNSPQLAMPTSPSLSPDRSPSPSPSPSPSLSTHTATADIAAAAASVPALHHPQIHMKPRPRTRSQSSCTSEERTFAPEQSTNTQDDSISTLSVLARHSLVSPMTVEPFKAAGAGAEAGAEARAEARADARDNDGVPQRQGPRRLMSEDNLKRAAMHPSTPRRLAISSPPTPSSFSHSSIAAGRHPESSSKMLTSADLQPLHGSTQHSSSWLYPKGVVRQSDTSGPLSSPSQSGVSSIADLNNCSSASMTTNMLGIKSHVFKSHVFKSHILHQQDQPQLKALPELPVVPIYQLSTPSASNNSLSSRPVSPVNPSDSAKPPATQAIIFEKAEIAALNDEVEAPKISRPGMSLKEDLPPPVPKKSSKIPYRLRTNRGPSSSTSSLASPLMEAPEAGRELQLYQQQEHYFATVFDDLRSKTQNVLRKAGFSIAPDAGLFADHSSGKPMDLKVVRMFPAGSASSDTGEKDTTGKSSGFFGRPRSRSVKERCPVLLEAQPPPLPPSSSSAAYPASAAIAPPPAAVSSSHPSSSSNSHFPAFRLDRLRHWNMSDRGGHQRSNSGPARHSDLGLQQKLTGLEESRVMDQYVHGRVNGDGHVHIVPLPPLPPLPPSKGPVVDGVTGVEIRKKKKGHQRRLSEVTTFTVASTQSAGAYPQRFQVQQQQFQQHMPSGMSHASHPQPEKQQRSMSNWFGIGKRRSYHSVDEDSKKPHVLGNGIEGGVDSRPNSTLVLDVDEYDEDMFDYSDGDDEENDSQQHQGDSASRQDRAAGEGPPNTGSSEKKPSVVVNDYGFILEDVDEEKPGQIHQDPAGLATGSTLVGEVAVKLDSSFLAEHERKRVLKKLQEHNRMSEIKWIQAITTLQPDQVKKSSKYKKLARRGVPTSVRGRVWQFLANSHHYRVPGLFQELMTRGHIPIHDVIARDVHRCYPDHVHFRDGMGGTGQEDLHSILKAYAHYKPSVGYCQGMGRLVGMMLMQMPVEEAFWLLVATIEGYLNEYFTPTLRQLRIDAQVFERLLKSQDPRLAQHLQKNDTLPIMYMTQWFLTLFTMSLPWASVLRVWDVFYFDGIKTLFRVGLAVLQICRSHLLEHCPSSSECMDYLLHVPLEILGPEVLLERTAYRIRLRRENIEKISALTAGEMDAKEGGSAGSNVESQRRKSKKNDEYIAEEEEEGRESKAGGGGGGGTCAGSTAPPPPPPTSFKKIKVLSSSTSFTTVSPSTSNVDSFMSTATTTTTETTATASTAATTTTTGTKTTTTTTTLMPATSHAYNNNHNININYTAYDKEQDTKGNGRTAGINVKHRDRIYAHDGHRHPVHASAEKELPELPRPRSQPAASRSMANLSSTSPPSSSSSSSSSSSAAQGPRAVEGSSSIPIPCSPLPPLPPAPSSSLPNSAASFSSSGFSALSVFRTRKRAGTMHR